MHAQDLIDPPRYTHTATTRKPAAKVPNWHLTSPESLDFIEAADDRARLKAAKTRKMETIKKEAVKAARKEERGKKKSMPK